MCTGEAAAGSSVASAWPPGSAQQAHTHKLLEAGPGKQALMVHADPSTLYSHNSNQNHEFSQPAEQRMLLGGCLNDLLPELTPTLEGCYMPSLSAPHHHYDGQQQQQQLLLLQRHHLQLNRPAGGTAPKRLRWSAELHRRFEVSVEQLGGPDKALPSQILKLMNVEQLTIFHIKSHLQRYRGKATTSLTRESSDPGSGPSSGAEPSGSGAPAPKPHRHRPAPRHDSGQTIAPAAHGTLLHRCSSSTPAPASPPSQPDALLRQASLTGSVSLPPPQPMQAIETLDLAPPSPAPAPTSQPPPPAHSPDPLKLQQALITQMQLQNQLYNQLKVQKELQASLEMHALYIQHLVGRSQSKRASQGADCTRPQPEVQSRPA